MTYSAYDSSVEGGMPVELYRFNQGPLEWNYTSSAEPVLYLSTTYTPEAITRSSISQTGEMAKDGISLVFPRDNEFAAQFLGQTPDLTTTLTLYRGHLTDGDAEFVAYWKGRAVAGSAAGAEVTVECESVFTSMRRSGLRARFQRTCRHSLYGSACGLDKASYAVPAYIQSSTSFTLVNNASSLQPDGTYTGGMVELESGAMRFIVNHVGDTLYLSRPFAESVNGQTVSIFPGCDHLKSTCITKFNNLLNFGGFPYIPNINPFGGSSIV